MNFSVKTHFILFSLCKWTTVWSLTEIIRPHVMVIFKKKIRKLITSFNQKRKNKTH